MVKLLQLADDVSKNKKNVSELLDALVIDALAQRASDIHMEAQEDKSLLIRYRIDGVLHDIVTIEQDIQESLLFIIKVRAKLRTDIHFAPQDGKIPFVISKEALEKEQQEIKQENEKEQKENTEKDKKEGSEEEQEDVEEKKKDKKKKGEAEEEEGGTGKKIVEKILQERKEKEQEEEMEYDVDARISILPVTHGEKVVIRLLTQANRGYGLKDLGFQDEDLVKLKKAYSEPYGLILATGPTGSGKTTTLYSIIKILNTRDVNITTIEDPVEYGIEGVNHIQINTKADLTFVNGLRSILRQDPDIIMVGEIRDQETARITVNSALTGHLVLSTLHANDAVSAVPRLLDMGIEPFLIASTVNIIVTQRLARRLCPYCKKEYTVKSDKEHKELLELRPDLQKHISDTDKLYKAVGCKECNNTGYTGRIGIYEILEMNKEIRDVIITNPNSDEILDIARKSGFTSMTEDGIEKLKEGIIDIKELIKVIALKE
jgi:type II secretory ATPase GspE/PulE/Tfp pilus assembly ATPase PilB-like protein